MPVTWPVDQDMVIMSEQQLNRAVCEKTIYSIIKGFLFVITCKQTSGPEAKTVLLMLQALDIIPE